MRAPHLYTLPHSMCNLLPPRLCGSGLLHLYRKQDIMANQKKSIGKYRIVEELARGPLGSVYRAEDTSRQHAIVALKLIHAAQFASAQERSVFLQEAQLLTTLKHPYILPVLDAGIDDQGFPYLVTAY